MAVAKIIQNVGCKKHDTSSFSRIFIICWHFLIIHSTHTFGKQPKKKLLCRCHTCFFFPCGTLFVNSTTPYHRARRGVTLRRWRKEGSALLYDKWRLPTRCILYLKAAHVHTQIAAAKMMMMIWGVDAADDVLCCSCNHTWAKWHTHSLICTFSLKLCLALLAAALSCVVLVQLASQSPDESKAWSYFALLDCFVVLDLDGVTLYVTQDVTT